MGEFLWIIVGLAFVIFMLCKEGYWEVIGCILGFILAIAVLYWLIQANAMLPAVIIFLIVVICMAIYIKVRDNKGWFAIHSGDKGKKLRQILSQQTELPYFKFSNMYIEIIYGDYTSPFWTTANGVPENVSISECYDWLCVQMTEFLHYLDNNNRDTLNKFLHFTNGTDISYADSTLKVPSKRTYEEKLELAKIIGMYCWLITIDLKYKRRNQSQNESDYNNYIYCEDEFAERIKKDSFVLEGCRCPVYGTSKKLHISLFKTALKENYEKFVEYSKRDSRKR